MTNLMQATDQKRASAEFFNTISQQRLVIHTWLLPEARQSLECFQCRLQG